MVNADKILATDGLFVNIGQRCNLSSPTIPTTLPHKNNLRPLGKSRRRQ